MKMIAPFPGVWRMSWARSWAGSARLRSNYKIRLGELVRDAYRLLGILILGLFGPTTDDIDDAEKAYNDDVIFLRPRKGTLNFRFSLVEFFFLPFRAFARGSSARLLRRIGLDFGKPPAHASGSSRFQSLRALEPPPGAFFVRGVGGSEWCFPSLVLLRPQCLQRVFQGRHKGDG
ncbi:hypothetical protein B0H16DRAFT_715574 [Mycena metata]|uniref:Uncharacterized protein n=1 Tax=Mycena metata TaxID=1033252 RepID=A0AAD7J243_9AGAR|nr:hypothetical protein B0H16DRAFT_715574 [Mycena metata]